MKHLDFRLAALSDHVQATLKRASDENLVKRIWSKDAALWVVDEAGAKTVRNALGWLTVVDEMIGVSDELLEYSEIIRNRGIKYVMVCGMGGSSLCPEVLRQTFGHRKGFPELIVLDSTDPDVLYDFGKRIDVSQTLFIIASKSGSTTEPTVFYKFWYDEVRKRRPNPGENFIAITDPGSPLIETANELGFQRIFLNQSDIGGRFSALSYFGMVPAALAGIDIKMLLNRAKEMVQVCSPPIAVSANSGLQLGIALGEAAAAGRDKLTLVLDDQIASLGLWIEQLIAESTGKQGKGILPVAGERLGITPVYAADRVFVSISVGPNLAVSQQLDGLAAAGHPIVKHELNNIDDLGAEFFLWEFATACVGWRLQINPFDQPNVQEAKDLTKDSLSSFVTHKALPIQQSLVSEPPLNLYAETTTRERLPNTSLVDAVRAHLASIKPNDYVALLVYSEQDNEADQMLEQIRTQLRDSIKCATTSGYGPRYLHSTGQFHKGGPNSGVFFEITANDKTDLPVPGEPYTFSILKQAQALGDFRALADHERRLVRIELGDDAVAGLRIFQEVITKALAAANANAN